MRLCHAYRSAICSRAFTYTSTHVWSCFLLHFIQLLCPLLLEGATVELSCVCRCVVHAGASSASIPSGLILEVAFAARANAFHNRGVTSITVTLRPSCKRESRRRGSVLQRWRCHNGKECSQQSSHPANNSTTTTATKRESFETNEQIPQS